MDKFYKHADGVILWLVKAVGHDDSTLRALDFELSPEERLKGGQGGRVPRSAKSAQITIGPGSGLCKKLCWPNKSQSFTANLPGIGPPFYGCLTTILSSQPTNSRILLRRSYVAVAITISAIRY